MIGDDENNDGVENDKNDVEDDDGGEDNKNDVQDVGCPPPLVSICIYTAISASHHDLNAWDVQLR